ncbi:MAG TPA: hypothetical protein VK171_01765 [Fimbriimonas sp.]|nr:hypothetical protein [Fimbriimonas sp.]
MVTKIAGIALCSAFLIGGTFVLATTPGGPQPAKIAEKETISEAPVNQPVLPHDKDMRTYLKSVASFMEVPPRDGFFGVSRVPTIHGQQQRAVPGYEEIKALGKSYEFVSGAIGKNPNMEEEAKRKEILGTPNKLRMAMMHRLAPSGNHIIFKDISYGEVIAEVGKVIEQPADSKGYKSAVLNLDKAKLNVMAKVVKATDESCIKCHQGVKKGEPVGHVFAMYTEVK